ncbi:MAG: cupin domain-containing protein [Rhizobiales bacterium]|nr:cupin domain-containing protein [Hyphomicrobiales bacterium]
MRLSWVVIGLVAVLLPASPGRGETVVIGEANGREVVTVRVGEASASKQGLPIFPGISGGNAGARAISMTKVVVPAGGRARPHVHRGYETAIYIVSGDVETFYGPGLRKSVVNRAGDFLFIPADVPHMPVNLSQTDEAVAIVARSDPNEQESVVPYDPASGQ